MSFTLLRRGLKSNRRLLAMKISFPNHHPLPSPGINARFLFVTAPVLPFLLKENLVRAQKSAATVDSEGSNSSAEGVTFDLALSRAVKSGRVAMTKKNRGLYCAGC